MHCYCSPRTFVLANICLGYAIACVLYLVLTRSIGTPFADSLSEKQRLIKRLSIRERRNAFVVSSVLSAIILIVWRPLKQ